MFQKRTTTTLPASTEASSGRDGSPGAASSARPGFAGLAAGAAGFAAGLAALGRLGGRRSWRRAWRSWPKAWWWRWWTSRRRRWPRPRCARRRRSRRRRRCSPWPRRWPGRSRPGGVTAGSTSAAGLGRSTRNHSDGEDQRDDQDDAKGKTDLVHALPVGSKGRFLRRGLALLDDRTDPELAQLAGVDGGRSAGQRVAAGGRLGEGDDVADRVAAGDQRRRRGRSPARCRRAAGRRTSARRAGSRSAAGPPPRSCR